MCDEAIAVVLGVRMQSIAEHCTARIMFGGSYGSWSTLGRVITSKQGMPHDLAASKSSYGLLSKGYVRRAPCQACLLLFVESLMYALWSFYSRPADLYVATVECASE
jgi:hypothetical protein